MTKTRVHTLIKAAELIFVAFVVLLVWAAIEVYFGAEDKKQPSPVTQPTIQSIEKVYA